MLSTMFSLMESDPFNEIGKYLDDGPQVIATGVKSVTVNGTELQYGPAIHFSKKTLADRIVLQFEEPKPKARIGCRVFAVVDRIEYMATGDSFAVATVPIVGVVRQKIQLVPA